MSLLLLVAEAISLLWIGAGQIYINITVGEVYKKGPEFGLQNQSFVATHAIIHKI